MFFLMQRGVWAVRPAGAAVPDHAGPDGGQSHPARLPRRLRLPLEHHLGRRRRQARTTSVVEPEPQFFAVAEPECIPVLVPETDLDPDKKNGIKNFNYQKWEANFLGNNAASNRKKARFCENFLL